MKDGVVGVRVCQALPRGVLRQRYRFDIAEGVAQVVGHGVYTGASLGDEVCSGCQSAGVVVEEQRPPHEWRRGLSTPADLDGAAQRDHVPRLAAEVCDVGPHLVAGAVGVAPVDVGRHVAAHVISEACRRRHPRRGIALVVVNDGLLYHGIRHQRTAACADSVAAPCPQR